MNSLQQIIFHLASRPIPTLSITSGSSVTLALYSWFEKSLPVIQWLAAAGAILCSILSLAVIVLTLEYRIHMYRTRQHPRRNHEKENSEQGKE